MFKLSRLLIVYIMAVPLAVFLGYLVSSPNQFTFTVIGMVLMALALPLFLKWHHVLLIVFWNSVFSAFFLPGHPDFWLLFGLLGFGIAFTAHILFQTPFLRAPELTWPILFLATVIVVTAEIRGGVGIRALGGSSYGGRYYLYELGAIAGYFAFTSKAIPVAKGKKLAEWFFGSGITFALGNVIYTLGPAFYLLYYLVPTGGAVDQAMNEEGLTQINRISGLAPACISGLALLLAHYGIRGLFDFTRPWRLAIMCITIGAAFFSGFRSGIAILFLLFSFQFYFEGLMRTHYLPIVAGLAICGLAPVLFFAGSMPASVQRAISFLPVNINSEILEDARGSSDWRFGMWAVVSKEIPRYLWVGKGYAIDPNALLTAAEAARMGLQSNEFETYMLAGDYHSGPLSVIVPLGLFGSIAFIWLLIGGYRVLSLNRRYGDPRLRRINTTLLAFFATYCVSFFFIFGALSTELPVFLGVCGFSVSLNGGVRRRALPRRTVEPAPQATMAVEPG